MSNDSNESQATPSFLFLSATGRSGTTILRRSLGLHPEIYYNGQENNVVQDVIDVAQRNCTLDSRIKALVVNQDQYDAAFRQLLLSLIWPQSELRNRKILMAAINPTGDLLDYLVQVFPEAKILGLVRNGIEVVNSRTRYASFADAEFEQQCAVWTRSQGVVQWGQKNPERFRLFRHEWMYGLEIDRKLGELFSWLQISNSPEVAANLTNVLAHPTSDTGKSFESMSAEEKKAYFASKSAAWKNWSSEQRTAFLSTCGPLMGLLEYEIPFD